MGIIYFTHASCTWVHYVQDFNIMVVGEWGDLEKGFELVVISIQGGFILT